MYSVPVSASVRAKTYCTTNALEKTDFQHVIKYYPDGTMSSLPSRLYGTVASPSVCASVPHAAAAGLLLWARRPRDVDLLVHCRCSARRAALSADGRRSSCCVVAHIAVWMTAAPAFYRRDALPAHVLAIAWCPPVSVCLSVCLSVTSWRSVETDERIELCFGM